MNWSAMADTEPPRSPQVKLSMPRSGKRRSGKRGPPSEAADSRSEKGRKVGTEVSVMPRTGSKTQSSTRYQKSSAEQGKSETRCSTVKENWRGDAKDSRTGSEECKWKEAVEGKNEKGRKVGTDVSAMPRSKTHYSTPKSYAELGKSETRCSIVNENLRSDEKDSRIGSEECKWKEAVEWQNEKGRKAGPDVSAMPRSKTHYSTVCPKPSAVLGKSTETLCSIVKENSRTDAKDSRTGLKKAVEGKKEMKKRVQLMDRYKKMQCWAILKRLMIGRDGWAFKQPAYPKALDLEVADNSETMSKAIGLEDVESRLNKWLYLGPDEFADDIRLVFFNALLDPPKDEICGMARRLSESFEFRWKSLKERWSKEDRKRKRDSTMEAYPKAQNIARAVHEKKCQEGNKGNNGDLRDSQYCDADKTLLRQKRSRLNTDSCLNFQGQSRSTDSTSEKELNMSISDSQLSPLKASYIAMPKCQRKQKEKETSWTPLFKTFLATFFNNFIYLFNQAQATGLFLILVNLRKAIGFPFGQSSFVEQLSLFTLMYGDLLHHSLLMVILIMLSSMITSVNMCGFILSSKNLTFSLFSPCLEIWLRITLINTTIASIYFVIQWRGISET